jgi:hypothetical protein
LCDARRVYIETKYGESCVQALKDLGCKWDPPSKCWWVGKVKRKAVEELLAKTPVAETTATGEVTSAKPDDPHDVRLVAKVKYKGRTYYARYLGETKRGYSARVVSLPDADGKYLDFWITMARQGQPVAEDQGEVIKTYAPRVVERYGYERKEYTTLGSIKSFIDRQKNPETRRGFCSECGSQGPYGERCECYEGTFG